MENAVCSKCNNPIYIDRYDDLKRGYITCTGCKSRVSLGDLRRLIAAIEHLIRQAGR